MDNKIEVKILRDYRDYGITVSVATPDRNRQYFVQQFTFEHIPSSSLDHDYMKIILTEILNNAHFNILKNDQG